MSMAHSGPRILRPITWTVGFVARSLGMSRNAAAHEYEGPSRHLAPWVLVLSFAGLPLAAFAASASRLGEPWAVNLFYCGAAIVFLFPAFIILKPDVARLERIEAVALLTLGLFIVRLLREPVAFIDHDEFLHWTTANHLIESGRLFSANALLPISPRYPGIEIVTTAVGGLTGLTVFQAAQCVLFACRAIFVASLFFAYERLSGSAHIAACGCLLYTGCSTFLVFDTQFSYESMAVALLAAGLLADVRSRSADRRRHVTCVLVPIIAALALTHHMTAYFAAAFFAGMVLLELVKAPPRHFISSSLAIAAFAILAPIVWSQAMGNPGAGYLGPVLAGGLSDASKLLAFATGRKLFVSTDGYVAPLWQRAAALGSVGLVCLGLTIGFFRALNLGTVRSGQTFFAAVRRPFKEAQSGVPIFVLLTLAFPVSMLFRLTKSGWEIGNRMAPFAFIGVAFVVAVGVVALLASGRRQTLRTAAVAVAGLIVFVGGVVSAQGPRLLVPARFKVSSDSSSIGPMAIEMASWSRQWLGERNLFSSDRINRLLLSTYGGQDVATTLQDGYDTSDAVLAPVLGASEKALLKKAGIDYLATDLRITTDLPGIGVYFDGGAKDHDHSAPPSPEPLLKFDAEPKVGRLFDNGSIFIYDLRVLDGTL